VRISGAVTLGAALPALVAGVLLLTSVYCSSRHPWAHPLWLLPLGLAFFMFLRRPHLGLYALLALLPVASQAIWSGWRVTDEFDLLLMAVLSAAYARLALERCSPLPAEDEQGQRGNALSWLLLAGILASTLIAAWLAWLDLSPGESWGPKDWLFGDYDSPANVWRVGKSAFWLLLALPWLHHLVRLDREAFERALCQGMLSGLVLVCGLAVWERHAYVGLWNLSQPYRTTAWFWEMHVGGAPSMPTWCWQARLPVGRCGRRVLAWPGRRRRDC